MSVDDSATNSSKIVNDKPSSQAPSAAKDKDTKPNSVSDSDPPASEEQPSSPTATSSSAKEESKEESKDEAETDSAAPDGVIDMETFRQILDLDEDDTHDFSREMVEAYYKQAGQTFIDMDEALKAKNLEALSSLGHFLKGSSATLGVSKVQHSCEKIQHYGKLRDEEVGVELTKDQALGMISKLMGQVKGEYDDAERWMRQWYKENSDEGA